VKLRIKETYSIINALTGRLIARHLNKHDATLLLNALISSKDRARIDVDKKYRIEAIITVEEVLG
jgi:hypothetical protein